MRPHMRGEDGRGITAMCPMMETPPRVWGRPAYLFMCRLNFVDEIHKRLFVDQGREGHGRQRKLFRLLEGARLWGFILARLADFRDYFRSFFPNTLHIFLRMSTAIERTMNNLLTF